MNSVSWFLYLSDVAGNFQPLLGVAGTAAAIAGVICMAGRAIEDWEDGPKFAKRCAFVAVPLLVACTLIPSRTTFYAIAASQVGEQIASDPDVKGLASDAKKALRQWIKKQIDEH